MSTNVKKIEKELKMRHDIKNVKTTATAISTYDIMVSKYGGNFC